jgi:hypothetical protein
MCKQSSSINDRNSEAAADLVIAPDPPEWEAQVAGTLRFLAVLSYLGRFHGETSFRWVPEAPLAENVPQRATYVGRYSVLSERRRLENLTRREQKGALNLRPRHSSGDTTIIPRERPRQSVANGQRERSCGSSPVRRGNREDFPFPGEN